MNAYRIKNGASTHVTMAETPKEAKANFRKIFRAGKAHANEGYHWVHEYNDQGSEISIFKIKVAIPV
jgi:hypothetical protein